MHLIMRLNHNACRGKSRNRSMTKICWGCSYQLFWSFIHRFFCFEPRNHQQLILNSFYTILQKYKPGLPGRDQGFGPRGTGPGPFVENRQGRVVQKCLSAPPSPGLRGGVRGPGQRPGGGGREGERFLPKVLSTPPVGWSDETRPSSPPSGS